MNSDAVINRLSSHSRWALLLLIALLSSVLLGLNIKLGPTRRLIQGQVETVRVEDFKNDIQSAGVVEPEVLASVKSDNAGAVAEKMVREGDVVQAGQRLMEFSMTDAKAELVRRQAAIGVARNALKKVQSNYQMTRELYRQHAIPKKELTDAEAEVDNAKAAVGAATNEYQEQQKKMAGFDVVSPFAGVVLSDKVGNNSWVAAGAELFVIGQLDRFRVRAKVDELDISKVRAGQPAEITLEAFPGVVFPGVVENMGAEAQQGAFAEIDVMVSMTDLKGMPVKPNLSAKVGFQTGQISGALTIPINCVQYEGNTNFVSVISPDGQVTKRALELGPSANGRIVVSNGLGVGEMVLVPTPDAAQSQ